MFEIRKPSTKIKDICQQLGEPYMIKVIDAENVIYRSLNNIYDFEISGLDNQKKLFSSTIYVWDLKEIRIVETVTDIKSIDDLKTNLDTITSKYLDLIKLS
jgi:hypothetical protein